MSERLVWAFQPLKELNHETGFVACSDALATELIASGKVQDTAIGAHHFKEIQTDPPAYPASDTYETKVLASRKTRKGAA